MEEKKIELKNVSRSFRGQTVLKDLDLAVKKGESLVILGRSGCGKSVLLKHMIGLMKPDAGSVTVDGTDLARIKYNDLNRVRKKFGFLFQGAALFDSLTVFENVGFQLIEYTRLQYGDVKKRVAECLAMVGLEDIEHLKPAELSGGMKKRVGLARAICMSPEIILYDEPTAGLDPIMGDAITKLIRYLHDKLKITSVTVTHDIRSAYKIADRICLFNDRRLIEVGSPLEVQRSTDEIVRQFVTGDAIGPLTAGEFKLKQGEANVQG
jgi:phospholipid/cholesterol/gamma-HCH transport system ATP-binding protein